jgi:hypothetical protein
MIIREMNFGSESGMTKEEGDFLNMVKTKTPDSYNRFLSLLKNKGLEVAREKYMDVDPDAVKQRERERKSLEKKQINREKGDLIREKENDLLYLLPQKKEMAVLVDVCFGDMEFRMLMQKRKNPQIDGREIKCSVKRTGVLNKPASVEMECEQESFLVLDDEYYKEYDSSPNNPNIIKKVMERSRKISEMHRRQLYREKKYGLDAEYFMDFPRAIIGKLTITIKIGEEPNGLKNIMVYCKYVTSTYNENYISPFSSVDSYRFSKNTDGLNITDVIKDAMNDLKNKM